MPRPMKKKMGGAWGDAKKWQNTLTGGLKFSMLHSTMQEGDQALGAERFNVATKANELNRAIDNLHDNTMIALKKLRNETNKDGIAIFEKVLLVMRWSNPSIPVVHQEYICDYIKHLLSPSPQAFCHSRSLCESMFGINSIGTKSEKTMKAIAKLVHKIKKLTILAYLKTKKTKSNLIKSRGDMVIKKESILSWMVKNNSGRKDRFWTSWYYAQKGQAIELERYLIYAKRKTQKEFEKMYGSIVDDHNDKVDCNNQQDWKSLLAKHEAWKLAKDNDVNEKDPDFGLSPLHYSAKNGHLDVIRILINHGANINSRAPDGRTPLHYAAQYSNKYICLELLSFMANVNAIDKYGCTPSNLAEQAKNLETFQVCMNWNGILDIGIGTGTGRGRGKSDYQDAADSDDDSFPIPLPVPLPVLLHYYQRPPSPIPESKILQMTADQRIFCQRFFHEPGSTSGSGTGIGVGIGDDFDDVDNIHTSTHTHTHETFLDIRVCAKFANLCMGTGSGTGSGTGKTFTYEGIKSLKRGFHVAKDFYLSQYTSTSTFTSTLYSTNTFTSASVVAIAQELIESLIKDNQEGTGIYYIDECLSLPNLGEMVRIGLLARKTEILLCLWDIKSKKTGTCMPVVPLLPPLLSPYTSYYANDSAANRIIKGYQHTKFNVFPTILTSTSTSTSTGLGTEKKQKLLDFDRRLNVPIPIALPYTHTTPTSPTPTLFFQPTILWINTQSRLSIEEAIENIELKSQSDLYEPLLLCTLLELLADITEREGDIENALQIYIRCECITLRCVGINAISVRVAIQVLRLMVSCATTSEGFKESEKKAKDLSKMAEQLQTIFPSTFALYNTQIIELVSLARLLASGTEKVTLTSATGITVSKTINEAKCNAVIVKPLKKIVLPGATCTSNGTGMGRTALLGGVRVNKKQAKNLLRDLNMTESELLDFFGGQSGKGIGSSNCGMGSGTGMGRGTGRGTGHVMCSIGYTNPYGSGTGMGTGIGMGTGSGTRTPKLLFSGEMRSSVAMYEGVGEDKTILLQSAARILNRRNVIATLSHQSAIRSGNTNPSSNSPIPHIPTPILNTGLLLDLQTSPPKFSLNFPLFNGQNGSIINSIQGTVCLSTEKALVLNDEQKARYRVSLGLAKNKVDSIKNTIHII